MENGQQEVQPSITLGRAWRKLPEDMSQIDTLQRSYGNKQRLNPNRQFKLLEESKTRIRENQVTIQAIEEQLNQTEPTLIPSGSQGVDQPNSPVALHHSKTRRSVAKGHHSSQSKVFSRRTPEYKGKNIASFRHRKRESDPMIQKLLSLMKEVQKSKK
ncbi:hypothetical protein O181_125236 [Austropuccinia psidii MF-1]|uniref:Uncharacterized protein n=1 Tax=Austropuccinia psidii MF-1 TaxID=1389203 RepID=A0A9Q3KSQ7_9BASI|nr:hypothetical protein [Austropuccinia psidii MF-1]